MIFDKQYFESQLQQNKLLLAKVKKSLKNAPEGSLRTTHNKGTVQYFHLMNPGENTGKYIRKKNTSLIHKLAQKDYDLKMMSALMCNQKTYQSIISAYNIIDLHDVYAKLSPERRILVDSYTESDEQFTKAWKSVEYVGREMSSNVEWLETDNGELVRSKSEKMIADKLVQLKIPYRYEYPLYLKGFGTVHPDFTILDVKKRKEYIWEHFGMMDDEEYLESAIRKIRSYEKNGYYLGDKLILTFETRLMPIDMKSVEKMLLAKICENDLA